MEQNPKSPPPGLPFWKRTIWHLGGLLLKFGYEISLVLVGVGGLVIYGVIRAAMSP